MYRLHCCKIERNKRQTFFNQKNFLKKDKSFICFRDLDGFPYNGIRNLYDGGGYTITLGNTAKSSRKKLEELKTNNWIDRHTAAIFIEFTVERQIL